MTEVEPSTAFTILVVCTGNICRSPLAEQLLRTRLTAAGVPVRVVSAGTRGMVGHGMTSEAAALSLHYGAEPTGHEAQLLTEDLIASAEVVLTATREHRSDVVSLLPRASRYTFTLNQFARLIAASNAPAVELAETPADTLRAYLNDIAATRGLAPPPAHPDDDDIIDPYRRSQEIYDLAGYAIDTAVTTITSGLTAALGKA